jgi:hypothetical protein
MTFAHIPVNALSYRDKKTGTVHEGWPSSGEDVGLKILRLNTLHVYMYKDVRVTRALLMFRCIVVIARSENEATSLFVS